MYVAHGLATVRTPQGHTQTITPGQYAVTSGRTVPHETADKVVMFRNAATVTSASPFAVVMMMDMGRCLHSSTFQLNLTQLRHKIHPEHPLILLNTPDTPSNTP